MADNNDAPIKENKLQYMLMTNGDEVIGHMYETDDKDVVCLKNPLIVSRVDADSGFNIHLNKWIPYSDDTFFAVRVATIATHAPITENLIKFYDQSLKNIEKENEGKVETVEITEDKREQYLNRNIILH